MYEKQARMSEDFNKALKLQVIPISIKQLCFTQAYGVFDECPLKSSNS